MPKCPECKLNIDTLRNEVPSTTTYYVKVDDRGELAYQEGDTEDDDNKGGEFFCPECDALLFTREDEAEEFLCKKTKG